VVPTPAGKPVCAQAAASPTGYDTPRGEVAFAGGNATEPLLGTDEGAAVVYGEVMARRSNLASSGQAAAEMSGRGAGKPDDSDLRILGLTIPREIGSTWLRRVRP
jgi:hypothetical protein